MDYNNYLYYNFKPNNSIKEFSDEYICIFDCNATSKLNSEWI